MCTAKKPKVKEVKEKEPTIIRNLYLDGQDPVARAMRSGRSSLRIDRGGSPAAPRPSPVITPTSPSPTAPGHTPIASVGADGRRVFDFSKIPEGKGFVKAGMKILAKKKPDKYVVING